MSEFSDHAERAMKDAAGREPVPVNLERDILRAVRVSHKAPRPATAAWRGRFIRAVALAAGMAIVAGAWWSYRGERRRLAGGPTPEDGGVFSDLNPATLVSTSSAQEELALMENDLRRAAAFLLAQVEDRASPFL